MITSRGARAIFDTIFTSRGAHHAQFLHHAERGAEGSSPASQNRYLAALKSIYKAATTYGFCKMNPAAAVTMQSEEIKPKDVLDDEEFERLLAELPDYSRQSSWRLPKQG